MHSFALGLATLDGQQKVIEIYYPHPVIDPDAAMIKSMAAHCAYKGGNADILLSQSQRKAIAKDQSLPLESLLREAIADGTAPIVAMFLKEDQAPASVSEVYLKLHLLSHRLCKPHSLNLQGAFGILRNIAWTNQGAIAIEELGSRQLQARAQGRILDVMSVDKFPKMVNYIVPSGVRIADTARVRLGAYVGEGTTVMHEGFINFNAGTEGSAMIEGRISAGVVVGEGSDLGGGCSTMGTLSGGGTAIISVGRDCLIGANAGIGIALGDRCVVEAGLYVTGGTKVGVLDNEGNLVQHIKAKELSGKNDLLFRRNSQTGAVECKTNKTSIALNEDLHSHN
ncbi:MAG: 2,3,4,5-tetrahydropyridine-2,6-dicarboxylate N-succinyltransferase [Pseudohongiella sp.]|nr:2,3,4,5-tetrahydropyridine-2,6-dicarboxylate N-succinyltransferase [Pseudohongiella sp.]MDO9519631.1 2,3,4,5-tetrahydropyridine-2,6-dicarboxylate N-succinyltransferase [Pseudohongiella sp.]MDP2127674.1 2,3,4,5-tetrahydropyridine-2,6-dicarboxylate N-succinyltransferase [Pseudohongiella sp.]